MLALTTKPINLQSAGQRACGFCGGAGVIEHKSAGETKQVACDCQKRAVTPIQTKG
jgi:hypothetical protein